METKVWSSEKVTSTLNYWAISPAPRKQILSSCLSNPKSVFNPIIFYNHFWIYSMTLEAKIEETMTSSQIIATPKYTQLAEN